ncbi:DUF5979 domain-containing protein [Gleimia sp. 6138-11-ORH1]|uniref:DUF5979 domain-containing protein n=1 Tax=Gleimia sp. 6138-11-ORH1 TaxID=2973937 RepID=UPI002167AA15|nr:DUF5979 domain-containing protein [Gleimia sp. 6138-11-ORH1]MCS4485158.1 DUF5979 domain-containing protein [Gleimia sp. 6138-11-ORH1]
MMFAWFSKQQLRSAFAVVTTIFLTGMLLGGNLAVAADEDITVTPGKVIFTNGITDIPDRQLEKSGRALLSFNWDATGKPGFGTGDKFTIDLSPWFKNLEAKTVDLKLPMPGNPEQKVGSCVLDDSTITCTFDENVDRLKTSYSDWRGTVTLETAVLQETTSETVEIHVNGVATKVVLPTGKNGEVGIIVPKRVPASVYKSLNFKEGAVENNYTINMSGIRLKRYMGELFIYDDPNQKVRFTDALVNGQAEIDPGQKFKLKDHPTDPTKLIAASPEDWILRAVSLDQDGKSYQLDDLRPGPNNRAPADLPAEIGQFELTVEFDKATPHIARILIKGPFSENYNYSIGYATDVVNPEGVQEGTVYSNRLNLEQTTHSFQLERSYRNTVTATAEAVPGFGAFGIEKRISGTAESLVKADHTVTVNYTYELPLTADNYANWTAPGTLNPDNKTGKASCTINFRKTSLCLAEGASSGKLLPKGSKVFITPADEDLNSISAEIRDFNWGTPIVDLPGNAAFLTIKDNGAYDTIAITNKANFKTAPFAVVKKVAGLADNVTAGPFDFSYTCQYGTQPRVAGEIKGVPGDGTPVVTKEEFPVGSNCIVVEIATTAQVSGHRWKPVAPVTVVVTDKAQKPAEAVFTNEYTKVVAKFAVKKTVSGLDAGVNAGPFSFDYTCVNGTDAPVTGKVTGVTAGGPAVASDREFKVGSVCTITEDETTAKVDGYTLTPPAPVEVTIAAADQPVVEAAFNNAYTKDVATFSVKKTVTGLPAGVDAGAFNFTYSCVKGAETFNGRIDNVPADGLAVPVGTNFPVGSVCTITEIAPAPVDGYALAAPAPVEITLDTKGQTVEVPFTNAYTKVVAPFAVKKTVSGLDAGVNAGPFDFTYSCVKGNEAAVEGEVAGVVAGGPAVVSAREFAVGSVCTITEKPASAAVDGYTLTTPAPVKVTIAAADQPVVEAAFENVYSKDLGTFSVKKLVTGLDAFKGTQPTYSFKYVCTKGGVEVGAGDITGVTAGGAAVVADKKFPIGAECVVTEQPVAEISGHMLTLPPAQTVAITDMTKPVEVTFTNVFTKVVAPFAVKKTVSGLDAGVNAGPFDFTYSCVKGNEAAVEGEVTGVVAGGPAVVTAREFAVGSVCTITEKPASAAVDGYTLTTPAPVKVTIAAADQPVVEAAFENVYSKDLATFSVKKTVTGLEANTAAPKFAFTYSCVKGNEAAVEGRIENVPGDGTEVPAGVKFPVGSVCTVAEDKAAAQVADYDLTEVAPVTVTLDKKDFVFQTAFENVYQKHEGSFVVGKEVKGVAAGVALPTYDFAYKCQLSSGDILEGTLKNVAAGNVSDPVVVPVGTVCEVEETASPAVKGYTLVTPKPQTVKVSVKGEVSKAGFVNVYDPVKVETPKKPLPKTGVDAGVLGGLAVVLFAAGVLLARKRQA